MGATFCVALYNLKVFDAKHQWSQIHTGPAQIHTKLLEQHAATTAALCLTSAAITLEAALDYKAYCTASRLSEIERILSQKVPFFLRSSVLGTALVAMAFASHLHGGIRVVAPPRPVLWREPWEQQLVQDQQPVPASDPAQLAQ